MDGVEEFTAAEGRRSLERRRIAERIAFAIFSKIFLLFSLITAIVLDGVTAEVAEHSEDVFR